MIFIDFDSYVLTLKKTLGCNYTRNCTDIILKRGQIAKNWAPTNLVNISRQRKILNLVLKKRYRFFKEFFKNDNCLILRL